MADSENALRTPGIWSISHTAFVISQWVFEKHNNESETGAYSIGEKDYMLTAESNLHCINQSYSYVYGI